MSVTQRHNQAMPFRQAQGPEQAEGERMPDRCMTRLKKEIMNYETNDARPRPPSLILFSLGLEAPF
jgi:hypothetical protein